MVRWSTTRGERGAIAVWASVSMVAFILCVGLGVDLAGHATAQQRARSVAAEAARAGGQYLVLAPGLRPSADIPRAIRAADAYVASSGLTGSTTAEAGELRVRVDGSYETLFLGIIGVESLPLHGTSAAGIVPVVDGNRR